MADTRVRLWLGTTLCLVFATSCRLGFDEQLVDVGPDDIGEVDIGLADAEPIDLGLPDTLTPSDASLPDSNDTGVDAGVDAGAEEDAGVAAAPHRILDENLIDIWMDVGEVRALVFEPLGGAGAAGALEATTPWIAGVSDGVVWQVTASAMGLGPGTHTSSVVNPVDRSLVLAVRMHVHQRFTIGPTPNACNGACDGVGPNALTSGNQGQGEVYTHFVLYGGPGTEYDGILTTAGPRWISPAVQVAPDDMIRLRCEPPGDAIGGAIKVQHAPTRVEGLRIDVQARCNHAVVTDLPRKMGAGQRIWLERLWLRAMNPENRNTNNIDRTMRLGSYVTLRHSMVDGYFEGGIWTNGADGIRVENNTLLSHDGPSLVRLFDSTNAIVANNVAVALGRTSPTFVDVTAAAQNILVEGNVLERYATAVALLPGVTSTSNTLGQIPLDAPILP